MIFTFILLQFSAYLLAYFIFNSHECEIEKRRNIFTKYHLLHGVIVFLFSYLLSFNLDFWYYALLLAIIHSLIDLLKRYLQLKNSKQNYFYINQIIHIIVLIAISLLFYHYSGISFIVNIPFNLVLIITGFIFCAKPANIFIKNVFLSYSIEIPFNNHNNSSDNDTSLPNAGKLIGISERFLVLALILVNQFSAVGLIIAAKSILRYKSTTRNEYILVGTLLSFGIAVLTGIIISKSLYR